MENRSYIFFGDCGCVKEYRVIALKRRVGFQVYFKLVGVFLFLLFVKCA